MDPQGTPLQFFTAHADMGTEHDVQPTRPSWIAAALKAHDERRPRAMRGSLLPTYPMQPAEAPLLSKPLIDYRGQWWLNDD